MTLLVFTFLQPLAALHFPLGDAQVETLLVKSLPQFEIFVLSFVVIGAIWINYHEVFNEIKRYSRVLVWLNFIFLIFVVFIPFSTLILGGSTNSWLAVVFYAAIIGVWDSHSPSYGYTHPIITISSIQLYQLERCA
jgi:uncharacterized membrane protein